MFQKTTIQKFVFLLTFLFVSFFSFSQKSDSTKVAATSVAATFSGSVTATNNGVALIPTFSLGKPAIMFDFAVKGKRLSFEPSMYFAVEGAKPWAFIFWVRYKLIQKEKFTFNIGTHPSFVFADAPALVIGDPQQSMSVSRFWASEFVPNYAINKNLSIGAYYLYGKGLTKNLTQNTHFMALNATFSNINLSKQLNLRFIPQVYYLNLDGVDGFYTNGTLILALKNCPVSISGMASKSIKTNVSGEGFVWNVGLTCSF